MMLPVNVLLLKAWLKEQGPALIGARLKEVRQQDERSLLIDLLTDNGPCTVLLSVLEEYPVLAVVGEDELPAADIAESNFAKALNFHLSGYRLSSIAQQGFDRSVVFTFHQRDQYGQETLKVLRHELVGRASNAFLISERAMVVSIFKRVRREQNRVRRIITGKLLPDPPPLGKFIAAEASADELAAELAALAQREGVEAEDSLEHLFTRRIAGGDIKLWPALEPLLPVEYDFDTLYDFIARLQDGAYTAQLFGLAGPGEANARALANWRGAQKKRGAPRRPLDMKRARLGARLDQLHAQLAQVEQADKLEQLALAMLKDAAEIDEGGEAYHYIVQWQTEHKAWAEQVNPELSMQENAQQLVQYAQRLRRGRDKLKRLVAETEQELVRHEQAPRKAKPAADPLAAHSRKLGKYGVRFLRFVSTNGFLILCGLDDKSNDGLLRLYSTTRHLWLHARDFPGSHVLVLTDGRELPHPSLEEAAVVAAYYSQGRNEREVEVAYTPLKLIRRVKGGKPGQVLKMQEKVISVRPERFEQLKGRLRQD